MPLVRWACPPDKPTFGEAHEPSFCITECDHKCASPFLIAALTNSVQSNHHKGKYISATGLSGCTRKLKLERTVPYADEMQNAFYAYRGTVMHQVVEDAASVDLKGLEILGSKVSTLLEAGFITEFRMSIGFCFEHGGFELDKRVSPWDEASWEHLVCPGCKKSRKPLAEREVFILGGTCDGLEPVWSEFDPETGILWMDLWDLKTMKEYAMQYFIKGDPKNEYHKHVKDEHYIQAQVYKYLIERSAPPAALRDRGVKSIRLRSGNIQAFSMGDFPRTGGTYRWRAHFKHDITTWEIPSIEFREDAWIETFIKTNARPIYEALILDKGNGSICPPEKSSKGSHSWACDFCAFHKSPLCPDPKAEWAALTKEKSDGSE